MQASRRSRLLRLSLSLGACAALAGLALLWLGPRSAPGVCDALARGRIVRVFADPDLSLRCDGVAREPLSERVAAALEGRDAAAFIAVLREHKGSAVAVLPGGRSDGVGGALAALAHVPGLRALVVAPELAVYAPFREVALSERERDALAYVARALFRGAREPSLSSFPPSLRRVERVEVMVTLSDDGEPRLWRSARANSIARALLTATRVARERWRERQQAMGGPLGEQLLELDVEVALLSEDGTLIGSLGPFVDRAVTPLHGIGFDRRAAWHYVLPREVVRRKGGARALAVQLDELGLTREVLSEPDTRLYRFVVVPLGRSRAPLSEAESP